MYNTGNPLGSTAPKDFSDNSEITDRYVNDVVNETTTDRFGRSRLTLHGIEKKAQLDIAAGVADATAEAGQYRDQALAAKNAAQDAAMMSGFSKYADTLAQLEAGVGTDYVDGDVVLVFQDESRGGTSSVFKIELGAAAFKLTFDKTRQDLLSFTGNIAADAEWSDVPAHSDPAFDVQAKALADRTEILGDALAKSLAFNRTLVNKYPLLFPGHEDARLSIGSSGGYWYPHGCCYDEDENIYFHYSYSTGGTVVVVYAATGDFLSWFKIWGGGEAIVATGSPKNGTLKLYKRNSSDSSLRVFNAGSIPATGADAGNGVIVIPSSVALQYAHEGGTWIVEQWDVDLGKMRSRTVWNVYDSSFNRVSQLYIPKTIVGFQEPAMSSYYPYIPKSQGMALSGGAIYFGIGGSYIPNNDGPVASKAAYLGVAKIGFDGSVLDYGVCEPNAFMNIAGANGDSMTRTESEGTTRHPDGSIHHLIVTLRPGDSGSNSYGISVYKEFDAKGVDFSSARGAYMPFDLKRLTSGVWPRISNKIINPITLVEITTLEQFMDFAAEMQLPSLSVYSGATPITLPNALGIGSSSSRIDLHNHNNNAFTINMYLYGANGMFITRQAYRTSSGQPWTYANARMCAQQLRVQSMPFTADANKLGFIVGGTYASETRLFQGVVLNATESSNGVFIGGGWSDYDAATSISFYTTSSVGLATGTRRWLIDSTGHFTPGANNTYNIGSAASRLKEIYAVNSVINTSDGREKTVPSHIDDAALDAWGDVQIICYQWLASIAKKGEDYARWHFGVIAQQVRDAFTAHGIDGTRYGLLCYDEWEAKPEVFDDEGNVIDAAQEEGNRWGIRADQCLFLEAAYQRRRADRIDARLTAIEDKVQSLM